MSEPVKLICLPEAAVRLGLSVRTMRDWVALRKIEAVRLPTGGIRIKTSTIQDIIDSCTIPSRE
jgi:excisionase family DNA binding protein